MCSSKSALSRMAEAGAGEKEELKPEHYEDFFDCARYGELEGVGIYIDHGADVNWTDDFGNTALHRGEAGLSAPTSHKYKTTRARHTSQLLQMDTWTLFKASSRQVQPCRRTSKATPPFVSHGSAKCVLGPVLMLQSAAPRRLGISAAPN